MSLLCQLKGARRAVAVDRDHAPGAGGGVGGDGGRGIGLEQVPDAASEVALEAADGFAAGLAFGFGAGGGGGGLRGPAGPWGRPRRCNAQLSWRLPPWSRRWRWVRPEEAGIGAE